uniref:Uncharacterized protein n=1 Tax=Panagrolaimus sp. ES5 TaxID=591445 RepID=A0AC34FGE1_9BILA
MDSCVNSSILSLHIAAYENTSDDNECWEIDDNGQKILKLKRLNNVEHFIHGLSPDFQSSFEFPRQQENGATKPEMMQFKANQRLQNPNNSNIPSNGSTFVIQELEVQVCLFLALMKEVLCMRKAFSEFELLSDGPIESDTVIKLEDYDGRPALSALEAREMEIYLVLDAEITAVEEYLNSFNLNMNMDTHELIVAVKRIVQNLELIGEERVQKVTHVATKCLFQKRIDVMQKFLNDLINTCFSNSQPLQTYINCCNIINYNQY